MAVPLLFHFEVCVKYMFMNGKRVTYTGVEALVEWFWNNQRPVLDSYTGNSHYPLD